MQVSEKMRWRFAALVIGIVMLILGGGVAISAMTGYALAEFIYLATGIGVSIIGTGSTGIGAWKWSKQRHTPRLRR
jgi:hypothetical protein